MAEVSVVSISGSPRVGSYTDVAVRLAAEGARKAGARVEQIELSSWKLPPFGGDDDAELIERFRAVIARAQGLILGTPVYHDSLSGVLKNALDALDSKQLGGKVAGLISVGAGRFGHRLALTHLRAILRETNTWVLPREALVFQSPSTFAADGTVLDEELSRRLEQLGAEVVDVAGKLVAR
jgi:FMN reductase